MQKIQHDSDTSPSVLVVYLLRDVLDPAAVVLFMGAIDMCFKCSDAGRYMMYGMCQNECCPLVNQLPSVLTEETMFVQIFIWDVLILAEIVIKC